MSQASMDALFRGAVQHHQSGRLSEAERLYRQVLAQQPEHAGALHLLGVLVAQSGRLTEGIGHITRAINAADRVRGAGGGGAEVAAYASNLGKFLLDAGDAERAIAACRRAVQLRPEFAEAHYNMGNALLVSGRARGAQDQLEQARAAYGEALRLRPDLALAHKNLGTALLELGREQDAIASYRDALRLKPEWGEAQRLLGIALRTLGDQQGAITSFREALRLHPGHAETLNNLGNALQAAGQLDEAVASYREALRLAPELAEAHNNLGSVLKEQGEVDEAVACYRRAVELRSQSAALHSNLLLALNYQASATRQSLFEGARVWAQRHAQPLTNNLNVHLNNVDPGRRMRVGYVSADFRLHASAFFLMPLLAHHDPEQVEVFCYADVPRPDEITQQLRGHAAFWRETATLRDARLAELIRDDRIDILVDLKLHADHNRLLVFARKPAPVQVTWLGYPGTTGLSAIDYRLTDPQLDPPGPGIDALYAERTVRLPETFWCYDPMSDEAAVRAEPSGTSITLGCLNHFSKINGEAIRIWAKVLQSVAGSRLLLLAAEGRHRAKALDRFRESGIDAERIQFMPPCPRAQYLRLYHGIDIAMDSWPVNGHTTTFDALWMGVPVVTLVGPTALGRAGLSQLTNVGLTELIAQTPEQYVKIAVDLAGDAPRLRALRAGLRGRMTASPLMDGARFARHVESAYRQMWLTWCRAAAGIG